MSLTDDVGKSSLSVIDALRREPLSLALVIMNLALLGFFYFTLSVVAEQREREVKMLYDDKKAVNDMAKGCIEKGRP